MADVWFYHLEQTGLEAVLPELLRKTLDRGWRALVRTGSVERAQALDAHLWTFADDSFLPHGLEGRAHADHQPVLLTTGPANTNGAQVLFLADNAPFPELETGGGALDAFSRVLLIFDGREEAAVTQARSFWRQGKDRGLTQTYWQQSAGGRWEKKG